MSRKDEIPSPEISYKQHTLWSRMAGNIVTLIMATILSLNKSQTTRDGITTSVELVNKFSQDANNLMKAINGFCKTAEDLQHTKSNNLTSSSINSTETDSLSKNSQPETEQQYELHSSSDSCQLKTNLDNAIGKALVYDVSLAKEETSHVCVIEEEVSEISNYTVDPVTNQIEIETVEEYKKNTTCHMLKTEGIQASAYIKDKKVASDEVTSSRSISKVIEQIKQDEKVFLKEIELTRLQLVEDNSNSSHNSEPFQDAEPPFKTSSEAVTSNSPLAESSEVEENANGYVDSKSENVFLRQTESSVSSDEALLVKRLSDALSELRAKNIQEEKESLQPSHEGTDTSFPKGTDKFLLKNLNESFSKIKIEDIEKEFAKPSTEESDELMIFPKLSETFPNENLLPSLTISISMNTIEPFPELIQKSDVAIMVEPKISHASIQNVVITSDQMTQKAGEKKINISCGTEERTLCSQCIQASEKLKKRITYRCEPEKNIFTEFQEALRPNYKRINNNSDVPSNIPKASHVTCMCKRERNKESLEKVTPKRKGEIEKITPRRKVTTDTAGTVLGSRLNSYLYQKQTTTDPLSEIGTMPKRNIFANKKEQRLAPQVNSLNAVEEKRRHPVNRSPIRLFKGIK